MMWRFLMMDFTQFIPIPNVSLKYPLNYEQGILEYQTVPFLSFPAENYPKTIMKGGKELFNDWKVCDALTFEKMLRSESQWPKFWALQINHEKRKLNS